LSIKEKEKEIQKKRNIKSRKIDKRKRKILVLIHIITILPVQHLIYKPTFHGGHLSCNTPS